MKASARQQQLLLELQDIDTQILRINRKLEALPEKAQLLEMRTHNETLKSELLAKQRNLEEVETELKRIETDVHMVTDRKQKTSERLAKSVSSKEATALQDEMTTLENRENALEELQLSAMQEVEDASEALRDAVQKVADSEADLKELQNQLQKIEHEISEERGSLTNERDGLAAEVQRDLLTLFENLQQRYGLGAARLVGRVSGGSNLELDAADFSRLMETPEDELFFCPVSGVILVREQEVK